jgi:hypothetical protein
VKEYCRKLEMRRKEKEKCYPNQEEVFGKPPRCCWAACTLKSVTNLQKTASKSLLEMLQKHQNMLQKFLFLHRNFQQTNMKDNIDF